MKRKIFGLCAICLLASGCGSVPKLENGQEAIVSFKDEDKLSVDDFYKQIKDTFGLEALITMVDTFILEKEFDDYKKEAEESADAYIKAWIEQYGGEKEFLEVLRSQTSYQTIEGYQNYLYLSAMQSHAIEEYAKTKISDKEIEAYYNDEAIGDMDIHHILITSDVKENATSDEKKQAEEDAKKKAEEIISALNTAKKDGKDVLEEFKKLVKENTKDDATKDKDGLLEKINYGDFNEQYDELIKAAAKLKDGEYSTSVITTELGFHVIYKAKSYEKDTLENLKEDILKELADRYIEDNQKSVGLNALQHYRKEYNMEIQDDELKKQYSNYIQNALASIQQAQNEEEEK